MHNFYFEVRKSIRVACGGRTGILGMSSFKRQKIFTRMENEVVDYHLPTRQEVGDHCWPGTLIEFLAIVKK